MRGCFAASGALETLAADDQETVIKVIDAMIAQCRVTSALAPVDQDTAACSRRWRSHASVPLERANFLRL